MGQQYDVRPNFAFSNCLVYSSYPEGLPNAVTRAGALQLRRIETNINCCNEFIKAGETGVLIPTKDVNALVESMKTFLLLQHSDMEITENFRNLIVVRYN